MEATAQHLLYLLKAPIAGTVKTRLARQLDASIACRIYRRLVEHSFIATVGAWQRRVYYTPGDAGEQMRAWLKHADHFAVQPEGDLGDRMLVAVEDAMAAGAQSVALLGGDCPYVDAGVLQMGFTALATHDLAVGPATDGGYYTLLMKRIHRELFQGIAWGTDKVMAQTLERAQTLGLTVYRLPELEDVDDADAWERACAVYSTLRI